MEECKDCEDTGETVAPAYQSGGEIVDEVKLKCHCKCNEEDYDDNN